MVGFLKSLKSFKKNLMLKKPSTLPSVDVRKKNEIGDNERYKKRADSKYIPDQNINTSIWGINLNVKKQEKYVRNEHYDHYFQHLGTDLYN